jgi:AcrR family transcriptional regulator
VIQEGVASVVSTTRKASPAGANTVQRIGLREQNKIAKYNRILEAGRALFNERGYEGTTTQAVANAAGIGVGTLFSYVRTKEDLLIVVFMDDLQSAVHTSFRKVRAEDPLVDRILTLYDGLLQYHIRNFGLSRYLMREVVNVTSDFTKKKVKNLMQTIHNFVTSLIMAEQKYRGYAADIDRLMLSQNCFAIYYDVLQTTINEGGSLDDVDIILRNRMKLQIEPYYSR